jgi:hypothetical protein
MTLQNVGRKKGIRSFSFKRVICLSGLLWLLTGCPGYIEYNPDTSEQIDFLANANRLVFGPSTDETDENWVTFDQGQGTAHLYARNETNNAGKISGSEDGITFLFKEVDATKNFRLSADVLVVTYGGFGLEGEITSNGQEGFGLMVRDYVPQYPGFTMEDLVNATEYYCGRTGGCGNMAMIGGIKRGVRAAVRTGVVGSPEVITDPLVFADASKSFIEWWPKELADYSPYPTLPDRPDFPLIGGTYRLTLTKTNSGFEMKVIPPPGKGVYQEHFIQEPDILTPIHQTKYYVGFFAARAAEIIVSDISYFESNAADDAPRLKPTPEVFTPTFEILSPKTNSDGNYKIYASANVKGYLTVKQDGVIVPGAEYIEGTWTTEPTNNSVEPYTLYDVPVYDLKVGDNTFQLMFYPAYGQNLTSYASISRTFIVQRKSYFTAGTPIYVAPDGSTYNAGTSASPLDIQTAVDFVLPGQTIIMKNGVYHVLSMTIARYNNGRFGSLKRIEAEERDRVLIDFNKNMYARGAVLMGDYWEISGIHVRNTPDKVKGFVIMGDNNLIEWVKSYNHGDTGIQISGRSWEPKSMWPRNNIVRYCESYNNMDAAQTDADGFAAKLTVGEGNRFEWCVSHNNCDDGWDLYTKRETGTIGVVVIENCISYQNGLLMDGTPTSAGRNGYKLGGEGLSVENLAYNCLAFQNGAHGFTSNSNPDIILQYVTSFDNGGRFNTKLGADSRNFTIYNTADIVQTLGSDQIGLLSLYTDTNIIVGGSYRDEDKLKLQWPSNGYVWYGPFGVDIEDYGDRDGEATKNINDARLDTGDVLSTEVPLWNEDFTEVAAEQEIVGIGPMRIGYIRRNIDGTFDTGDFLRLDPGLGITDTGCEF